MSEAPLVSGSNRVDRGEEHSLTSPSFAGVVAVPAPGQFAPRAAGNPGHPRIHNRTVVYARAMPARRAAGRRTVTQGAGKKLGANSGARRMAWLGHLVTF